MEGKDKKEKDIATAVDSALADSIDTANLFFEKNKMKIAYALAAVLAVVLGFVGYRQYFVNPAEEEAQKKIFMAQKYFEKDSLDLALNGNSDFNGMKAIAEEYSSTPTGNLAKYYAGMALLRKGQYEEAISYLEDFNTSDEMIAALTQGAIGDAHVELGKYEDALKYFIKASKTSKNKFSTPVFLKKAGLVYEELKEYGKAAEVYELIKKDYKESPEGGEIDKYIGRARAKESNS